MEHPAQAPRRGQDQDALRARWLTAAVGLPVVGWALWAGGLAWLVFITVIVAGAFYEWIGMMRTRGMDVAPDAAGVGWAVVVAALWLRGLGYGEHPGALLAALLAGAGYAALREAGRAREAGASRDTGDRGLWLGIGLAVVAGLGHLVFLRALPQGLAWAVIAVGATWSTDTAAFFVGRAVKGPPLAPAISPRKTISGALGGLIGAAVWTGWTASAWLSISAGRAIALGVLIGCLSQAGDLLESSFKRFAGVKDSGRWLPGHGGILDRFDGLILVAPAVFYFQHFFF